MEHMQIRTEERVSALVHMQTAQQESARSQTEVLHAHLAAMKERSELDFRTESHKFCRVQDCMEEALAQQKRSCEETLTTSQKYCADVLVGQLRSEEALAAAVRQSEMGIASLLRSETSGLSESPCEELSSEATRQVRQWEGLEQNNDTKHSQQGRQLELVEQRRASEAAQQHRQLEVLEQKQAACEAWPRSQLEVREQRQESDASHHCSQL